MIQRIHRTLCFGHESWRSIFVVFSISTELREPYFYLCSSVFATLPVCAVVGNGKADT